MENPTLPPLDVIGPLGERLTLRALHSVDTVAQLSQRLGVDGLAAGDRALRPDERLADVDELRIGARLSGRVPTATEVPTRPLVDVAVVGGPDCGDWMPLGAGRYVIGRAASATIRVGDHRIEPNHLLLTIRPDGSVSLLQLTGSSPVRVAGVPLDAVGSDLIDATVSMGASTMVLRPHERPQVPTDASGSLATHPNDPWRRVVWRSPEQRVHWSPDEAVAPEWPDDVARPPVSGLFGAGVMAVGAGVMAAVMRNPMFAMFASIGVAAALVTFGIARITAHRRASSLRTEYQRASAAFDRSLAQLRTDKHTAHLGDYRTIGAAVGHGLHGTTELWQRRCVEELTCSIGIGTVRWTPPVSLPTNRLLDPSLVASIEACAQLSDVPAPLTIRPGEVVAFRGERGDAAALARAVIVQLATLVGPADWQLVVVTSDDSAWNWAQWLPHGAAATGAIVRCDGSDVAEQLDAIDTSRLTLLITDVAHLFATRTGPVRRFFAAGRVAAIALVGEASTVPGVCDRVLTIGAAGSASWVGRSSGDDAVDIHAVGVSIETADAVARRLASFVDPEDHDAAAVPHALTLGELFSPGGLEAVAIEHRWRAGGVDPEAAAPVGMSGDGRVDVDLVRDGPHALLAGTTGAGKSELLRTLVISLAASVSPEHLSFVLVDYKGGATFDACDELPHTVGVVTDLDDGLAERALVSLDAELEHRERLLRSVGAADLAAYRASGIAPEPIARLVVVIDEFAALAKELPDFLSALVGIAQRGRSLGVHLLLATQRPAGVINDDIRANTNLRCALRLNDRLDAQDVVGDELPATFSRAVPGRAALRLGPDELLVFQAARCTGPMPVSREGIVVERAGTPGGLHVDEPERPSELECAVAAVVRAAESFGRPRRPWVDPLEFPLPAEALPSESGGASITGRAIGAIDDPAHQCRRPLLWEPEHGSLVLLGAIGSGTTSTLIALAAALCTTRPPDRLHLHVIDARGDDCLAGLDALAHCSGVVRVTEHERLHRVLSRAAEFIDRQRENPGERSSATVVLMIDGYAALREAVSSPERHATFELLQYVVNNAASSGVALVVADDATPSVSGVPAAHRWIFHLDDPTAARAAGLRTPPVAVGRPGRLRVLDSGCEAQVALGAAGLASIPTHHDATGGPARVRVLAERVSEADLLGARPEASATHTHLPVGVGADDLGVAQLSVPAGEHVLVVGAARTGVSTALDRVVSMWRAATCPERIVNLDRRAVVANDLSDELVADGVPTLVVIDDAHRVDDSGVLAAIARGDFPNVTLIAGARADAVRSSYGHWTRELAKSRCGLVMSCGGDPDGDVLGVQLPRRPLVAARPGLAWIVDAQPVRQVQVVAPAPH